MEIRRAQSDDPVGGVLNYAALNEMSEIMLGVTSQEEAKAGLQYLWTQKGNRFSHEHTFVAMIDNQIAGGVTCMSVEIMDRALFKTAYDILRYRKFAVILYGIKHFRKIMTLARMKEGEEEEYHISMLATLPAFRGQGVGSALLEAAENEAALKKFRYISLTVKKDNDKALNIYESKGYQIVGDIEQKGIELYRMRKTIKPAT